MLKTNENYDTHNFRLYIDKIRSLIKMLDVNEFNNPRCP